MAFLRFLAPLRSDAGVLFFQGVTYLAQELVVIAIICWLFWCSNKKLAYTLGFSYFLSGLLVQGLKITFRIPRPWVLDPDFKAVESAIPGATGYSFPSGHTQSATSLFGTLGFYFKKNAAKAVCFLLIVLVGFSRMYLGCHTPKDVLVSFVLSILCSLLCYFLLYKKESLKGHEGVASLFMAAVCMLLTAYALWLYHGQVIDLSYAQDCVKASGAGLAFSIGYYVEQRHIRFSVPDSASAKIIRLVVGLVVAVVLQEGLKPLIGESLPASFVRYFLVVGWILIIYPFLFSRKSR